MTFIWGHRGASGYAPENTLVAFELANEMNADGIELDVQLTKDNQLVVCHDETIDRTSDHKGFIKDYTLEQLKSFNFNNGNKKYTFCAIPTLQEVLKLVKPTKMVINIELKTGVFDYAGIEKKVIDLVDEYQMSDRIIYSSFNHYSIKRVKELKPNAYCGFLHDNKFIDMANYTKRNGIEALHPAFYFLFDSKYVKEAKENNLLINAWTLNDKQYIEQAIKLHINAVITNYPDIALDLRNQLEKVEKV